MIVPQRNPTLPWADIQCKIKWDRRAPKPQYRWSFPQINLHAVTTLNQYLHIFSKVFLIVRTMPRPTPMGIRHEVFALACKGIKQGAIAARVGLTRATVNRIFKRHAATGSLVPGKSSGAPRKTTPRQDRALLRMVRQDCSVRHRTDSEVGIRFYWRTHSRAQNTPEWRKRQTAMRGETITKQITQTE